LETPSEPAEDSTHTAGMDVDALKRENAVLRRRLQSLELVFHNSVDVLLMVDAKTGKIKRISDAAENVLGYQRKMLIGREIKGLLPDTDESSPHQTTADDVPEILDGVFLDRKILCADGSLKSMDMTTSLVESNGFSSILITLRETSERRRFQREMMKKNRALDASLSSMIITDCCWRIGYANAESLNYWRYGRAEILRMELADLISFIGDFDSMQAAVKEKGKWEGEVECQRRDSTTFTASATAIAVDSADEGESCFVLSFLDITDHVRLEKRLTELSLHDSLTGLYNRRGFMTLGRQLLDSSRRKQPEIGLLYVDLDYLKLINDELGHTAGDSAIETTARLLRSCFRESDIIARLGGDEFVVLFLDTAGFTVESIRERIDSRLEELVSSKPLPFRLSLSIGFYATVLHYQTQIGSLLSSADSLMYEEKAQRRSRISEDDIMLRSKG
jgi:diguanylate cyclase (GGDEF)-like protein/PAS domain S-box-containing protein